MTIPRNNNASKKSGKAGDGLVYAAVLIIGNEILCGRTQDKNLAWLARLLEKHGILIGETRIIRDDSVAIIHALNHLRRHFAYVFTTGGIGPTHDDITTRAVADAFRVRLVVHPQAQKLVRKHYGDSYNSTRQKMARLPEGASLIDNPISRAPGFTMENVHVLAGVPKIMQVMAEGLVPRLRGSTPMVSRSISSSLSEGMIATDIEKIQQRYDCEVEIGSYPWFSSTSLGVHIVVRGQDVDAVDRAAEDVRSCIIECGGESIITKSDDDS